MTAVDFSGPFGDLAGELSKGAEPELVGWAASLAATTASFAVGLGAGVGTSGAGVVIGRGV